MESSGSQLNDFRETEEWLKGHSGELHVANFLQKRGWFVIPSYDYAGEDGNKAPKMQGETDSFVLPDLDTAKDGLRVWVEVKTKKGPTLYRKTQIWEHGIALRNFNHYLKVQSITGCPVHLVVVEEDTGMMLFGILDELAKHSRKYEGNKMSRGGMIFFPRSCFKLVHAPGVVTKAIKEK